MSKDLFLSVQKLPYFSKETLKMVYPLNDNALNARIKRAIKKGVISVLKRGLYVTEKYYLSEPNKTTYAEFISSVLRSPSYLSLEYVLAKYNMLAEAIYQVTCVTTKSNRYYRDFLGGYYYLSIKPEYFFGFQKISYNTNIYYEASLAKALFDFFYFKKNLADFEYEINEGLRLNWDNFGKDDLKELTNIIELSGSIKMKKILKIIKKLYA